LLDLEKALKQYWGYGSFLPLQKEAMSAVVSGRDSLVVLPTGGGKSLCFQAPAVILPGMAVIVSPLIALMKDQVDGLLECGVSAARLDSSLTAAEQNDALQKIRCRALKLLYVAPERLVSDSFIELLKRTRPSFIAVDEAHCISMWGHDFRPEYRQLGQLRDLFPRMAIHAYTATATEKVRADVALQLRLADPKILVGSFDRPNLVYRVERRENRLGQVGAILDRHKGESALVYCIRRADVDELCASLAAKGYRALPYHAGMNDEARKANQDAFIRERADIIVATVAFGMGIDKSNVRCVIHAGMPKSLEYYQQESGRSGRDGLPAECVLLYSGGDYGVWRSILENSEPVARTISLEKLNHIYSYCTASACRRKEILAYFGQRPAKDNCGACDVCLGDVKGMKDSLVTAQKILSCVLRQGERFGGDYTAQVLTGSSDERILRNGHDQLSTYGLLRDFSKRAVRDWIEQLASQGCLDRVGEFKVLAVTEQGRRVLKGLHTPNLLEPPKKREPKKRPAKSVRAAKVPMEGVDQALFEALRALRREIADSKGIPAYVVFHDATLLDMAGRKPTTEAELLKVSGVGEWKAAHYGREFLSVIRGHAERMDGSGMRTADQ
jgi:ATP-dependent DNA helicase RecQ